MTYGDIISNGLILPKKELYTVRDIKKLMSKLELEQ